MKNKIILLLSIAGIFVLASCSSKDNDEPDVLTPEQKTALSAMHGTFVSTLPIVDWDETIEFLELYNPPLDVTSTEVGKVPQYIQGKLRHTLYEGTSYVYYFRLNKDATRIYMGKDLNKWDNVKAQDFKYVNSDEFKIKETKATIWDTYLRK